MNLAEIAQQIGSSAAPALPISGVSIDSRQIRPGFLFVALRGERFDGHDFIYAAFANGAVAVVCERLDERFETGVQLVVADSEKALAAIATAHRNTFSCPIIALTGSNGKTTVKEMIVSILPKPALATPGNLNNHIGAPLSVLQLNNTHRYSVFELGANHAGEIAYTVAIVQPQVALVNNIAPAHIEGFGSIEGVAKAKGEIYEGLRESGVAVVNDDDDFAHFWDDLLKTRPVLRFSLTKSADVCARDVVFNEEDNASFTMVLPDGNAKIRLQVPGEHSVRNALAAATCCYAVGIDLSCIEQGLNSFQGVAGRMTYRHGKNQSLVIDDTYNANLRSVLTAVTVLAKRQGRRILVLGDMGELGGYTQQHHEEIGHVAHEQGIDLLMTCGRFSEYSSLAFGHSARHYRNQDELTHDLLAILDKNTTVLVKGSRSAEMEKIVHQLVG